MNDFLHSFPGQEKNEPVFIFARPYPLAFVPTALAFLFIFAASLLGQYALGAGVFAALPADAVKMGIVILGLFQLGAITVFLVAVFDFYYDILIVTDRRLVDIDQQQLLFRKIAGLSLQDVEDVSSTVKGLFPTIFNFGHVHIQTAAEKEHFVSENIKHPREVAAIIIDLAEQAKRGVSEHTRYPESTYVAVINNSALQSIEELQKVGAILPTDMHRIHRNAPQ